MRVRCCFRGAHRISRPLAVLADARCPRQHRLLCTQVAQSDAVSRYSWESTPFAQISKWSCATPDTSGVLSGPWGCLETSYKVSTPRVSGWDEETYRPPAGTSCSSSVVFAARTASLGLSRCSPVSTVPANTVFSALKSRKATRPAGRLAATHRQEIRAFTLPSCAYTSATMRDVRGVRQCRFQRDRAVFVKITIKSSCFGDYVEFGGFRAPARCSECMRRVGGRAGLAPRRLVVLRGVFSAVLH